MRKTCSQCEFSKEECEFYLSRKICKVCSNANRNKYYHNNKASELKTRARWAENNQEKLRATRRKSYEANRSKRLEQMQSYYKDHLTQSRERSKKWARRNRDKMNSAYNRRRSSQVRATPSWATDFFLAEIYHLAKIRTEVTGTEWHVDHIVPLTSKNVCGLHCEQNLRVIPAFENRSKNNKHWPDMWT